MFRKRLFMKYLLFLFSIFILISCTNKTEKSGKNKSDSKIGNSKKDSITNETIKGNTFPEGFSIFENMEQIQYCVPVPLAIYRHDNHTEIERGKHLFVRQNDTAAYIEISGMFRSDVSIGIKEYFENSYTEDDEAEGKIIERKKLSEKDSCFYAIGYWSNFPEKKFLEVTWFRKEDVVVYYVSDYSVDGQPFWESKIDFLMKIDTECQ